MQTRTRIALGAALAGAVALPEAAAQCVQGRSRMPVASAHAELTTGIDRWVIAVSGWPTGGQVQVFDTQTMSWQLLPLPAGAARSQGAAITHCGKAFFAGGTTNGGGSTTARVDIYDSTVGPPKDPLAWSTAMLGQARRQLAAAAVGDWVLFAGGVDSISDDVDAYQCSTGMWTTLTLLSAKRGSLAAATVGPYVLFAGGNSGSTSGTYYDFVDVYDSTLGSPTNPGTWSTGQMLSQARAWLSGVTVGDQVLFAGGRSSSTTQASGVVDVYDATLGTPLDATAWSIDILPCGPRMNLAAASTGLTAIFAGGLPDAQAPAVGTVDVFEGGSGWQPTCGELGWSASNAGAAIANGLLYVVGGYSGTSNTPTAGDQVALLYCR